MFKLINKKTKKLAFLKRGFSLVEVLVSTAVFLIIVVAVYQSYTGLLNLVHLSRTKIAAAGLANEQMEVVRNLPYARVGIVNGVPSGSIPHQQNITRDGIPFVVTTTIRNIDDTFDGVAGGTPNDTAPADYKLVEIQVDCPSCTSFTPLIFTGRASPKNLEAASNNGTLIVKVFDAAGLPVPQAQVHIKDTSNNIDIVDVTDNNGIYALVDTPPSVNNYNVVVTKTNYSTDQTYVTNGQTNPNPVNRDATVVQQGVTQVSLAIDRTSTMNVRTVFPNCSAAASTDFNIMGSKIIGKDNSNQPIYKYNHDYNTDGNGLKVLSNMEWDNYNFSLNDETYDLAGTISPLPVQLDPNSTKDVVLVVANKNPNNLLVTVQDNNGQPIKGASVRLTGPGNYDQTLNTDQGFLTQTNWSGGSGQGSFSDITKYFSQDGNIEDTSVPGQITLKRILGNYVSSGVLTSSTFDTGSTNTNYYQISWNPNSQPVQTGTPNVRFQIATNNDQTTWNFAGPDGTDSTYYDSTSQNISASNNGHRYLRYKVFLDSASVQYSPTVSDISVTYTSDCVPPGQVIFSGISNGSYDYTVSKTGYQDTSGSSSVNSGWKNVTAIMQAE